MIIVNIVLFIFVCVLIAVIINQINIIKDIRNCETKLLASIIDYKEIPGRGIRYIYEIAFRYKGETIRTKFTSYDRKIRWLCKDKILGILYIPSKDKVYWEHESLVSYIITIVLCSLMILIYSIVFIYLLL